MLRNIDEFLNAKLVFNIPVFKALFNDIEDTAVFTLFNYLLDNYKVNTIETSVPRNYPYQLGNMTDIKTFVTYIDRAELSTEDDNQVAFITNCIFNADSNKAENKLLRDFSTRYSMSDFVIFEWQQHAQTFMVNISLEKYSSAEDEMVVSIFGKEQKGILQKMIQQRLQEEKLAETQQAEELAEKQKAEKKLEKQAKTNKIVMMQLEHGIPEDGNEELRATGDILKKRRSA